MLCPNCGQTLPDHTTICPGCGQALPDTVNNQADSILSPSTDVASIPNAEPAADPTVAVKFHTEYETDSTVTQSSAEHENNSAATQSSAEADSTTAESSVADKTNVTASQTDADMSSAQTEMDNTGLPEEDIHLSGEAEPAGTSSSLNAGQEDPAFEASETSDTTANEATAGDTIEPPKKQKKRSTLAVVLTAIIGLLLVIVVCLTITLTTLSKTGNMPGFITAISDFFERRSFDADAIAVKITDQEGNSLAEISNEQLCYYYWGEYYYYVQTNGFSFDAATPLDEQSYSDTKTWQDFFLDNACTSLLQIESLKSEAEQAGFTMSEEYQEEYDSTVASMADYALQSGFTDKDGNGDILAYVQDSYGPAATVESFEQYLYDSYYVTAYSDELYLDLSFTDEEIESYYDENSDMFTAYGIEKSELPNVNVRHILIQPETDDEGNISDEAWDTAKSEAEPNLGGVERRRRHRG